MQHCETCNQKFTFGQILKSLWFNYKPVECSNCKTKYEHTTKNKMLGGLSVGLGTICGGLAWGLAETNKSSKILLLLVTTIFLTLLFSSVAVFFFSFEKKEEKNFA